MLGANNFKQPEELISINTIKYDMFGSNMRERIIHFVPCGYVCVITITGSDWIGVRLGGWGGVGANNSTKNK